MKLQMRKTYICPKSYQTDYCFPLMGIEDSIPQGNDDDQIVDDENDILSKGRKSHDDDGWGNLW